MKIIELLDKAMKTGDIIYVSGWALGMRYNKDNDCFIWCNPYTGQFNKSRRDLTGWHRVLLCGKILNQDNCMLLPYWINTKENDYYYKINHCPFCGEPIEISVVGEENMDEYYKTLSKQREELWKKNNKTDSKKKAQELYDQVHELDNQID